MMSKLKINYRIIIWNKINLLMKYQIKQILLKIYKMIS